VRVEGGWPREFTFANVDIAAKRAVVLWTIWVDVPSELEQTGRVPLCGVGHYLREEVLEPFRLLQVPVSCYSTHETADDKEKRPYEPPG
jgi:hypothetical protein